MGRLARGNLCVSAHMQEWLRANFGVKSVRAVARAQLGVDRGVDWGAKQGWTLRHIPASATPCSGTAQGDRAVRPPTVLLSRGHTCRDACALHQV